MNDYSKSLNLPKTSFQMRANLSETELKWIGFWKKEKIHKILKEINSDSKSFVLHDGPPYANGHLHLGHALNKVLKDMICRINFKLGLNVDFIPGWDCHGLPIEWEVEESYRKKKKSKEDIDILKFRKECRLFAQKWIDIQCSEFSRLGLDYDWEKKYTTMSKNAEATIVSELLKLLEKGILYLGEKPVMWSVVEQTALAEAEIEYQQKNSKSIYVKFPIIEAKDSNLLDDFSIIIWTTTPWTLPGNVAIAFSNNIKYLVILVEKDCPIFNFKKGEKFLFAQKLFDDFVKKLSMDSFSVLRTIEGFDLKDIKCSHPLKNQGFSYKIPVVPGFHVTEEAGTGFVHIAPGHGLEDFQIGKENNFLIPKTVENNGVFCNSVPEFAGVHVYKADELIINALRTNGSLVDVKDFSHSYPHSWRSKAPLIFRTTPQWFISMEENKLRDKALKEIETVDWIPKASKNRISSMVSDRPDWCISRQRSWGVPITIFIHKKNMEPIIDESLNLHIVNVIRKMGVDSWFSEPKETFLTEKYNPDEYERVTDILDVWFDSGTSHVFVLKNKGFKGKSDLYLEGSDQHRGWFQSSLLQSCALYDESPYKTVITHGFVLDENGKKMSKSLGNVISPEQVVKKYGADVLRLWVANCNYSEDVKISFESLDRQSENYRKIRNTLRFILGNLTYWKPQECVEHKNLPELEKIIRHKIFVLNTKIINNLKNYDFNNAIKKISDFCNQDLSATFFDIRKDTLYCESKDSTKRKSTRTLLVDIFYYLISWLSPIIPFTTEEAWQCWREEIVKEKIKSCHLTKYIDTPESWDNKELTKRWELVNQIKNTVSQFIEKMREDKQIKSSLEVKVLIFTENKIIKESLLKFKIEEILITSAVEFVEDKDQNFISVSENSNTNLFIKVIKFVGIKCERCWKIFNNHQMTGKICKRCDAVHY